MASPLPTFDRIFGVRRFPPGRLLTVLLAMRALAIEAALADLIERIDGARGLALSYIKLRALRRAGRVARGGGEARRVDKIIDDDLVEIARLAKKEADLYPGTPAGDAAAALVDAFFRNGVVPITQIPYDEELAVVEYMMPTMRDEHADAIALLGLERFVSRIEAHLPLYRAALSPDSGVSSAELGAAYEAMQIGLLRVLGWVMAMIDDEALRRDLLQPVFTHDDQLAAVFQARRRGRTIGGEDIPEGELDLDAEARAAVEAAERAEAEAEAERAAQMEADAAAEPAADEPAADEPAAAGAEAEADAPPPVGSGSSSRSPLSPLPPSDRG